MARVTSKLQVTIPKAIARRYGIEPGDEIHWLPAGDAIRVVPRTDRSQSPDRGRRLALFDASTARQRSRENSMKDRTRNSTPDRGWRREELNDRGVPDWHQRPRPSLRLAHPASGHNGGLTLPDLTCAWEAPHARVVVNGSQRGRNDHGQELP